MRGRGFTWNFESEEQSNRKTTTNMFFKREYGFLTHLVHTAHTNTRSRLLCRCCATFCFQPELLKTYLQDLHWKALARWMTSPGGSAGSSTCERRGGKDHQAALISILIRNAPVGSCEHPAEVETTSKANELSLSKVLGHERHGIDRRALQCAQQKSLYLAHMSMPAEKRKCLINDFL